MKEDEEKILHCVLYKIIPKPRLCVQSKAGYFYLQEVFKGAIS